MANASLFSPANPHFFQPLLPGFQSHLKIPAKFFSKHIEGKHEGKTVNLISDASEKTWKVKMEGHRLTDGWKEFVEAHDLRMGDFVVFRHEGDMLFHVTALGPSCCELQYTPSRSHDEDEKRDEIGESSRKEKEIKENVKTESDLSASDLTCFSISVTASNLSSGSVTVPVDFARRNGLNKRRQEIVLMNEEEKSWESEVRNSLYGQVFICQSWRSFCTASKLEVGDSCTFKLLRNAEKPVLRLCSRSKVERKKKIQSTEVNIVHKTGKDRFVKLTPTPNSLELGKQHLPVHFTRVNMLNKPREIILVDKDKLEWSMKLKADRGVMYIISGNGWKSFCAANEVVAGESLTLELIRGGTSPVLKFCSKMEQPPFDAEDRPHKRARVQRWSQETRPKLEIREKTAEDGEPSRRTRASKKSSANQAILQNTQPCSVSYKVAKVKQSVLDTLTSIRGFLAKLETMEQKLKDSLQEIDNLCMI